MESPVNVYCFRSIVLVSALAIVAAVSFSSPAVQAGPQSLFAANQVAHGLSR